MKNPPKELWMYVVLAVLIGGIFGFLLGSNIPVSINQVGDSTSSPAERGVCAAVTDSGLVHCAMYSTAKSDYKGSQGAPANYLSKSTCQEFFMANRCGAITARSGWCYDSLRTMNLPLINPRATLNDAKFSPICGKIISESLPTDVVPVVRLTANPSLGRTSTTFNVHPEVFLRLPGNGQEIRVTPEIANQLNLKGTIYWNVFNPSWSPSWTNFGDGSTRNGENVVSEFQVIPGNCMGGCPQMVLTYEIELPPGSVRLPGFSTYQDRSVKGRGNIGVGVSP